MNRNSTYLSAVTVGEDLPRRSTSPLFVSESPYFHPFTRPNSTAFSPKESGSRTSLSQFSSSQDSPLYVHGSVRDLKELRALYIPALSSEEDLTQSSTTGTTNYMTGSSMLSTPASRIHLPPTAPGSVSSPTASLRQLSLASKFGSPARRSTLARMSRSSIPPLPDSPVPKIDESDREASLDISQDLSAIVLDRFVTVVNSIDKQSFSGKEKDLVMPMGPSRSLTAPEPKSKSAKRSSLVIPSSRQINFSSTVYYYRNSQLPSHLSSLKVTLPIWPILCLAAQFSQRSYSMPSESERETFVECDVRGGTNAMVIKSVALDHIDLVVLSIRGTNYTSIKDWACDPALEPAAPTGFLDDPENLCHAGFLGVARQMIRPIALRLRQMLLDNPARSAGSLVITGHSTGGAIASLLYAHMLSSSQNTKSDLTQLRRSFNRIHCITFGAPPVCTLPLNKPSNKEYQHWLFFSIINEGDPVTLAERAYIRSLMDLYQTPPPAPRPANFLARKLKFFKRRKFDKRKATSAVWTRPAPTLSLPGRLIVLRGNGNGDTEESGKENEKEKECAEAYLVRQQELAETVFGDVMMHSMALYQRRVEILATEAARAKSGERRS